MRWVSLAFILFLSACQSVDTRNENSPYSQIPAGATLILNKNIDIPADKAAVYIQNGQLLFASGQIHEYDPHCKLEMRAIKGTPQPVKADRFTVTRVRQESVFGMAESIQLADAGGSPSPAQEMYSTLLDLRSDRQPEVFRLTCQRWEDRYRALPLSVAQIRGTLSDLFTLKLPGEM